MYVSLSVLAGDYPQILYGVCVGVAFILEHGESRIVFVDRALSPVMKEALEILKKLSYWQDTRLHWVIGHQHPRPYG